MTRQQEVQAAASAAVDIFLLSSAHPVSVESMPVEASLSQW